MAKKEGLDKEERRNCEQRRRDLWLIVFISYTRSEDYYSEARDAYSRLRC